MSESSPLLKLIILARERETCKSVVLLLYERLFASHRHICTLPSTTKLQLATNASHKIKSFNFETLAAATASGASKAISNFGEPNSTFVAFSKSRRCGSTAVAHSAFWCKPCVLNKQCQSHRRLLSCCFASFCIIATRPVRATGTTKAFCIAHWLVLCRLIRNRWVFETWSLAYQEKERERKLAYSIGRTPLSPPHTRANDEFRCHCCCGGAGGACGV